MDGTIPLEHIGETITVETDLSNGRTADKQFTVTNNMAKAVSVFVGMARRLLSDPGAVWSSIEDRLIIPNLDMEKGGVGDLLVYIPPVLHVVDYKHGKGVYVNVTGNAQFLSYGWGAYNTLWRLNIQPAPQRIAMTVVQPRFAGADPVRAWEISTSEMFDWLNNIAYPAVALSQRPDAPLLPNAKKQCFFCDANKSCMALAQQKAKSLPTNPYLEN